MNIVYEDEYSRVIHGDCLDVMSTLDQPFDAIITDPPYGTTACAWDSVIPFAPMWEQLKRLAKPRAAIVLFGSQPFTSALVMSNPAMFRYQWVWEKTNAGDFMLAKHRPRMIHEDIIVFSKTAHDYYPQMQKGDAYIDRPRKRSHNVIDSEIPKLGISNDGTRYPSSIQKFSNKNNNTVHPTQKPVALLEYLVATYTNSGDHVLDPFAGSGTTGVVCKRLRRHCTLIERDLDYCRIAAKRLAETQPMMDFDSPAPLAVNAVMDLSG